VKDTLRRTGSSYVSACWSLLIRIIAYLRRITAGQVLNHHGSPSGWPIRWRLDSLGVVFFLNFEIEI